MAEIKTVHGHRPGGRRSPEYRLWLDIKRRCSDTKAKDYPKYGGSGIRVSAEWNASFTTFLSDVGSKPSADHVLARKDRNGHYRKDNCEWVTRHASATRQRKSFIPVTVGGIDFESMTAACRHFGVGLTTALERIRLGATIDDAVTVKAWAVPRTRSRESYLRHDHPDKNQRAAD
jgi:hypothetical protein